MGSEAGSGQYDTVVTWTVQRRKVRVHVRTLPVGEPGHDHVVEVGEDLRPRLAHERCLRWQKRSHVARLHVRKDAVVANVGHVRRDVCDQVIR